MDVASGIAVTARDPEDVRLFAGPPAADAGGSSRWEAPGARTLGIAAGAALLMGAIGTGIAAALVAALDPATANRTTALVAGAIIGAAIGTAIAVRLLRR